MGGFNHPKFFGTSRTCPDLEGLYWRGLIRQIPILKSQLSGNDIILFFFRFY